MDTAPVNTVWCQHAGGQGTPAGAGEQQPGAGPWQQGSMRGAVQECRAGRQERRQQTFCSVVLWLDAARCGNTEPADLEHCAVTWRQAAPLRGMNGARPDTSTSSSPHSGPRSRVELKGQAKYGARWQIRCSGWWWWWWQPRHAHCSNSFANNNKHQMFLII